MTAGVLIMIMAFEVSTGWAFLTYLSVSLLSLFVTFDKEAALVFIMLFGHYPILRIYIQKIKIKGLRFLIKFAVLNLCAISYFYMTIVLFGLEQVMEEFGDFGKYSNYLLLGLANFLFLLYDFSLDTMYIFYRKRLMPKFKRKR